jgi:hypothetical protein
MKGNRLKVGKLITYKYIIYRWQYATGSSDNEKGICDEVPYLFFSISLQIILQMCLGLTSADFLKWTL